MFAQEVVPALPGQLQDGALHEGADGGRPLLAGEEGHLAEALVGAQHRQGLGGPAVLVEQDLDGVIKTEGKTIYSMYSTAGHKEAIRSFIEKREPKFNQ